MSDGPDLVVLARVEAGQEALAGRVERMQGSRAKVCLDLRDRPPA